MGVKEIVGSSEYGEKPYLISEMVGNFSHDVIVHGYDPHDALDNYVEYGQEKYGWDAPDISNEDLENGLEEGSYYMANGNYPLDLDYIHIREVDKEYLDEINKSSQKESSNEMEM